MSLEYNSTEISTILNFAHSEKRDCLYEFEVYEILNILGLQIPAYLFIKDAASINEKLLKDFPKSAVLKVVSAQIAHKQKIGGVKIIKALTTESLKHEIAQMQANVLSHFADNVIPEISGYLLTEFIEFEQTLGYEVLFGFRQDYAFGPILTLSKGGDDAEFFAKYYDPANLIIPPLDFESALKEISSTLNIRHKFENMGNDQYTAHLARATSALSYLAFDFSFISPNNPNFIITEMDINPFVVSKDGRFVAVDGFAKFKPASEFSESRLPIVRNISLNKFFNPIGIAVIGVSAKMEKYSLGREIARLLHNVKRNDLFLVNANGGCIHLDGEKYPLYKSIDEIDENIDLVVYAAPAKFTLDFLHALPQNSEKAIVLISGIPSEMNYEEFRDNLSTVLPTKTRIIGPNCMGVFYAPDTSNGINTLFIEEKKLEIKSSYKSNTALLTQSGALAVTMIDKLNNSCLLKAIVSFGNKYDVLITDLVDYFSKDDSIEIIALYIEGFDFGEGRVFFEQAKSISKPIIAYKSGKTEAGARAAASHTAAMSGSYEVFKAACHQTGVVLAEDIDDYENYVKSFALLSHKLPKGCRVAGVINAGFESTIGADELTCLIQAQLSDLTVNKLHAADKNGLVDISSAFIDVTPMADDEMYADFVEAVLQDDKVDCVFVAIVPHTSALNTLPENCAIPGSLAPRLVEMFEKYQKPIVVSVNAGSLYEDFEIYMQKGGLPVYKDVKSAVKSLDKFVEYHTYKQGGKK